MGWWIAFVCVAWFYLFVFALMRTAADADRRAMEAWDREQEAWRDTLG